MSRRPIFGGEEIIMTRLVVLTVILTVTSAVLPGCSDEDDVGMSGGPPRAAGTVDDGAQKFFVGQIECPVCGGQPIKAEHHSSIKGERLYFDRAECVRKFEGEPRKYLQQYCDKMGLDMPDIESGGDGS